MEEISNLVSIGRSIDEMRFSVGEATPTRERLVLVPGDAIGAQERF
jgi:hypothetical protein